MYMYLCLIPASYLCEHWKGIYYTSSDVCPLPRYIASLPSPALYEVLKGGKQPNSSVCMWRRYIYIYIYIYTWDRYLFFWETVNMYIVIKQSTSKYFLGNVPLCYRPLWRSWRLAPVLKE